MKAVLILEDGKSFAGEVAGSAEVIGEVIMNTAVVGYQEMLTDPANAGKILVLTYPLIGNYGVAPKFNQSKKAWAAGLVIKEKSPIYSNWQAKKSLDEFLKEENLPVISAVDTRSLAVYLRQKGESYGIISTQGSSREELLAKIENFRKATPKSFLPQVSVAKATYTYIGKQKAKASIAILDLGITKSIISQLETLGLAITLLPFNATSKEILKGKPDGLIISGGPEQDCGLKEVVENIKPLIGKLPILGIACGYQVLARALGAKMSKLKIGHRGVNYPVHHPKAYKGEITVQNHSYVVEADALNKIKNVTITGFNLNDRSVEEIESKKLKLIGVQYEPVSPGFREVNNVLKKFIKLLK